jgi:thioredoxin-like negative regulator of GroEL
MKLYNNDLNILLYLIIFVEEKKQEEPTPAKKEDCVFEVTSANFQKIVLESSVPVLLGIHHFLALY